MLRYNLREIVLDVFLEYVFVSRTVIRFCQENSWFHFWFRNYLVWYNVWYCWRDLNVNLNAETFNSPLASSVHWRLLFMQEAHEKDCFNKKKTENTTESKLTQLNYSEIFLWDSRPQYAGFFHTFFRSFNHCSLFLFTFYFFDIHFVKFMVAFKPKTNVTWRVARQKLSRVSEPKCLHRKSCPSCQGYHTCRGKTTRPSSCLASPRRVCNPHLNVLLRILLPCFALCHDGNFPTEWVYRGYILPEMNTVIKKQEFWKFPSLLCYYGWFTKGESYHSCPILTTCSSGGASLRTKPILFLFV